MINPDVTEPSTSAPAELELRLYVADRTPSCVNAIDNITKICKEHFASRCTIEIIDLLEHPQLAREADIVAVPTLVRTRPGPVRRIIGDLSGTEKVVETLRLRRADSPL
jgi:circadian clock protein KaiB